MFKEFHFFLVYDSPLIMHNPRSMVSSNGKMGKRKTIPPPEEEAELGAYRDEAGNLVFPSSSFRNCFLKAMTGYKIGRKSLRTLLSHVRTKEEFVNIVDPKKKTNLENYEIDIRRVVIQGNGIMRARPIIREWAVNLIFLMNAEIAGMTEADLLKQSEALLNEAGQTISVGDFRLEKKGWFGMFHVEKSELK